jgi:GTP pyrophosphokinase
MHACPDQIIAKILSHYPGEKTDLIEKAFSYIEGTFAGMAAPERELRLAHAVAVSELLADLNMDETTVIAGLLHDASHGDGHIPPEIEELCGEDLAKMLASLSRLLHVHYCTGGPQQPENFRRLVLSLAQDVRVVMVLLAHQIDLMKHLEQSSQEQRATAAIETLHVYAPLANRLGIYRLKSELEDLGIKYSNPHEYADIVSRIGKTRDELEEYIVEAKESLATLLADNAIKGEVHGRTKHIFSIYSKMVDQNIPFEKVYDRVAFRIVTVDVRDCYAALGVVHAKWTPIPGRFKDYIALPKANLYQSLHTSVIGLRGQPMEVQIRTFEMHRVAEDGIAAHWRYKEKRGQSNSDRVFESLRQLVESPGESGGEGGEEGEGGEFIEKITGEFFPDVIFVFTPAGEVLELPKGSTPIDFAFGVHSQVGMRCTGAKVNDRMVAINHQLSNGDRVEIITSKTQTPSGDWLEFAKSNRARNRIRSWIRTEQRQRSLALGRDVCEREFRKVGKSFSKAIKEGLLLAVSERLGMNKADEVLEAVGFGKMSGRQVLERVYPEFERKEEEAPKRAPKPKKRSRGIVIKGVGDTMTRFAKCCHPLPPEDVVGFITRGMGLTVHSAKCANLLRSDPDRRVDVEWGMDEDAEHPINIRVSCVNNKGMLANITQVLSNQDVNISKADVKIPEPGRADCFFEIMVKDMGDLDRVFRAIQSLKGVFNTVRLRS